MTRLTRTRRRVLTVAAAGLAAAVLIAGCGSSGGGNGVTVFGNDTNAAGLRGTAVDPAIAKPVVKLTTANGKPYDLQTGTAGDVTLMYFGYTHCPDVCPTTMADIAAALQQVKPAVADQVKVVFVSTDPDRDTGPRLTAWLKQFNATFIGLRGTFDEVNAAATAVGVPLERPVEQSDGSYTVTHGAQVLAFTKDNEAHVVYLASTQVADYVHDLPKLVAQT